MHYIVKINSNAFDWYFQLGAIYLTVSFGDEYYMKFNFCSIISIIFDKILILWHMALDEFFGNVGKLHSDFYCLCLANSFFLGWVLGGVLVSPSMHKMNLKKIKSSLLQRYKVMQPQLYDHVLISMWNKSSFMGFRLLRVMYVIYGWLGS